MAGATLYGDGTVALGYTNGRLDPEPLDRLEMAMSPIRRPLRPLGEEMVAAARALGSAYHGEEIVVCYSGGYDSESVLDALRFAGVPVRALVVADADDSNKGEIDCALRYLASGVPYDLQVFSFRDRMKSALGRELHGACGAHGSLVLMLPLLDRYHGRVVTSGHYVPVCLYANNVWNLHEGEWAYAFTRFFFKYGVRGLPGFFHASTELFHAYLTHPAWRASLRDGVPGVRTDYSRAKDALYGTLGLAQRERQSWVEGLPLLDRTQRPLRRFLSPLRAWLVAHSGGFM